MKEGTFTFFIREILPPLLLILFLLFSLMAALLYGHKYVSSIENKEKESCYEKGYTFKDKIGGDIYCFNENTKEVIKIK